MYIETLENRLHLFEDITSDNHDTIYEVVSAFSALCRLLSQKEILTSDEFNSIVNKRRYHPPTETKPVIHAHWVLNKERMVFVCSYCGESPTDGTGHTFDDRMLKERNYRYCRYCGAKMDEEVE